MMESIFNLYNSLAFLAVATGCWLYTHAVLMMARSVITVVYEARDRRRLLAAAQAAPPAFTRPRLVPPPSGNA